MSDHRLIVTIESDEWYPVHSVRARDENGYQSGYDSHIEVDVETVERWQAAFDTFEQVQNEISERAFTYCQRGHQLPAGSDCRCGR